MSVRAKFQVQSVLIQSHGRTVRLAAVTSSGTDDNASWSKWTPAGELNISITNPDAYDQFEVGKNYFLDFTPAPDSK